MSSPEKAQGIARAQALQQGFFQVPNLLRPSPKHGPAPLNFIVQGLLSTLRHHALGYTDKPLLLPFRQEPDGCTLWYACAASEAQLRALEAELRAFIGPSYAHFRLPEDGEFAADLHVQPLINNSGWYSFALWTENAVQDQKLLKQWMIYWDLLERRPVQLAHVPKSFDALRADFERALLARDESSANAAIAAMRDRFGISAENRLFLDIRLSAGLERWQTIARHRLLAHLVNLNLPQETYGDILEALYMEEVFPYEQSGQVLQLMGPFREMLELAQPLFRTRKQSRRPAVTKSFVLFELSQAEPQLALLHILLEALPIGAFGATDAAIRQSIYALQVPQDTSAQAWQAYAHEQFDRAYELLWQLADSADLLRALIRCSDEAQDPSKARAVLERIHAASNELQQQLEQLCPRTLPRVRQLSTLATDPAQNWFQRMTWQQDAGESLEGYLDRWREWARSVALEDLLHDPAFGTQMAQLLEHIALAHPGAYERVAALCHEVFIVNADSHPQFKAIYAALLQTLRLLDSLGDVELKLVRDALVHSVRAGLRAQDYATVLNDVEEIFAQVQSPHYMGWGLDVCDALATAPCPDVDARLRLLTRVVQAGDRFTSRLSPGNHAMLDMLAVEAGIAPVAKADAQLAAQSVERTTVPVGIVGIYSLDEAAAKRAALVLQSMYQGIVVRTNADEVCTTQLKSLAQRASIFVFAWKSSKHAAFSCIKSAIGKEQFLLMALGAGTSSMVDAVTTALAQQTSSI